MPIPTIFNLQSPMDAVGASISCVCTRQRPFNPTKTLNSLPHSPKTLQILPPSSLQFRPFFVTATSSSSSSFVATEQKQEEKKGDQDKKVKDDESMSIDSLHQFIDLNLGNWNGSFVQYDLHGNSMQNVSTRLAVSSYGEDELVSLIQTLYIKQPPSATSVSGDDLEPEWAEYKIKETNMFTVDKYQQIGFFPKERAFSLRYQTAGMLEYVLRAGVLGEDDAGEESPRNLKLPSSWPSVVCENCLYSQEKDMRARAFHIMDPKGILEMLLIFLEERGDGPSLIHSFSSPKVSLPPSLSNQQTNGILKCSAS